MMQGTLTRFGVLVVAVGFIADPAEAQYALGDGTALDANQQIGSGGRNVRRTTIMQDLALRNAIVTGTAASGKSFRGSVGYESASDFRGSLGSDDLYAFQRDSFYSGLATTNVRGLSGLQYSLGQSVSGQAFDMYGQNLIVRRPGSASTAEDLEGEASRGYAPQYDAYARTRGAIRSTAEFLSATYDSPSMLSMGLDEQGIERAQIASPLTGVKWVRQDNGLLSIGDRYEPSKQQDDETDEGFVSPHKAIIDRLRIQAERIDIEQILPTQPGSQTDEPEGDGDTEDDALEQRRQDAMDRLLDAVRIEFEMRPPESDDSEDSESAVDADEMRERSRRRVIQELTGLVVRDRPSIKNLIVGDPKKDLYALHMNEGQNALADGRWFDAEERFGHALKQRFGDSMAAAGRVHAQLGAGMILSGGKNLRDLFVAYPELVTVRYAPGLLPSEEAQALIRAQLKDRIERRTTVAAEAALLLAYVGYQTDDAESIDFGLDAIDQTRTAHQLDPDPMVDLLRAAWMPTAE